MEFNAISKLFVNSRPIVCWKMSSCRYKRTCNRFAIVKSLEKLPYLCYLGGFVYCLLHADFMKMRKICKLFYLCLSFICDIKDSKIKNIDYCNIRVVLENRIMEYDISILKVKVLVVCELFSYQNKTAHRVNVWRGSDVLYNLLSKLRVLSHGLWFQWWYCSNLLMHLIDSS